MRFGTELSLEENPRALLEEEERGVLGAGKARVLEEGRRRRRRREGGIAAIFFVGEVLSLSLSLV